MLNWVVACNSRFGEQCLLRICCILPRLHPVYDRFLSPGLLCLPWMILAGSWSIRWSASKYPRNRISATTPGGHEEGRHVWHSAVSTHLPHIDAFWVARSFLRILGVSFPWSVSFYTFYSASNVALLIRTSDEYFSTEEGGISRIISRHLLPRRWVYFQIVGDEFYKIIF